jgi:general secretion pathway protein G
MRRATLIAFFLALAIIAIPLYLRLVSQVEEAVRIEDALVLQQAIDAYTVDIGKAPHSLDHLITAGYLKAKPECPIESDPLVPQDSRT